MSNYNGTFTPGAPNDNWNKAFELISDKSYVLDVGCSKGGFGEALGHFKGCKVEGIEPDKGDANEAKTKLVRVINDNIESAINKLKDGAYDHIVFLDVIEHLYNPVFILQSIQKKLKPNGTIVFSIPNMGHISVRLMLLGGDFEYGKTGILDNTHLHYYTEREIARIFTEAQLQIDVIDGVVVSYNDEVLKEELEKVGIQHPSKDLISVLESNNSHIYQYVGSASRKTGKKQDVTERRFSSPNAKGTLISHFEGKIEELSRLHREEIGQRDSVIAEQRRTIDDILNSKSWRLLRKIAKVIK